MLLCAFGLSVINCCLFCLYRLVANTKVEDEEEVAANKTLSLAESVNGSARFGKKNATHVELSATTQ